MTPTPKTPAPSSKHPIKEAILTAKKKNRHRPPMKLASRALQERIIELILDGKTRTEAYEEAGISSSAVHRYCQAFPKFADRLDNACAVWDNRIEDSLKRRAEGWTYTERTTVREVDPLVIDPSTGKPVVRIRVTETQKFMPPDTTAIRYWLNNRRPKIWREKMAIEVEQDTAAAFFQKLAQITDPEKK